MLNIPMLLQSGPGLVEGVQAYSSELPVMASEDGVAVAKVEAREVAVIFLVHRLLKPIGMRMSLTRIDLEMASGKLVQGGNFRRNAHKRIQSFPVRVD